MRIWKKFDMSVLWECNFFMLRWFLNKILSLGRKLDVEYEKHLQKERQEFEEIMK